MWLWRWGEYWGAPQVVQGPSASLLPTDLRVKGGKTMLTQSTLICLMFLWEPSCSQNKKVWGRGKILASAKKNDTHISGGKNRVYFFELLFLKLVLMFLLFQGDAFHSMCPKCAVHIEGLLHPAHTQCTPSFERLCSNSCCCA